MEILGIIIAIAIVVTLVSAGIGTFIAFGGRKRASSQDMDRDKCAQCKLDKEWYDSQPLFLRIVIYGWWIGNSMACKMSGC